MDGTGKATDTPLDGSSSAAEVTELRTPGPHENPSTTSRPDPWKKVHKLAAATRPVHLA